MAKAKTNFRNATGKGLQQKAGMFYERLLATALHCKRSPRGKPEYADLFSPRLDARIEVKARGDSNGLGLRVSQIKRLSLEQPFPTPTHALYALVPYRSRRAIRKGEPHPRGIGKKTTMVSLFRHLKTDTEFNRCWAANTPVVYLLDVSIINAMKMNSGTILGFYPDRPDEEALLINRTTLKNKFQVKDEDLGKSLEALGLKSTRYAKGAYPLKVRVRVSEQSIQPKEFADCEFTLVTILPKRLNARVAKLMARRANKTVASE